MNLPSPREELAGCVWLPRLIAKARALSRDDLPAEYQERFCHPTGVDAQFLEFFRMTREEIVHAAALSDSEVIRWFLARPSVSAARIAQWNHVAVNLGRPGFPMADRLPIALATSYCHLASLPIQTVFEALEADEANP